MALKKTKLKNRLMTGATSTNKLFNTLKNSALPLFIYSLLMENTMKINKQAMAVTFLIGNAALSSQAFAESHSEMKSNSSSAIHSNTMNSNKNSFNSSVEYGKNRNAQSPYQVRISEVLGETVEKSNGDNIGEIDDIVYSGKDQKLMAIISVGGFLGIGEKLVSVPYNELRVSANGDDVYLDSTKDALKAKPEFKYNDGEMTGHERRMNRIKSSANSRKSTYANSIEYGKMRGDKSLYQVRASELIGETVEKSNGDNIGEIDDLVYSATDHKLMAIIAVGGFLGMGEKLVAVPYDELRVSADGDNVYLDSTKDKLKAKPEFKYNKGEKTGMKMNKENSSVNSNSLYANSVEYNKMHGAKSAYQVRASELIGETVERPNGDNIGEIDDLIYSGKDQKLTAIIAVGGFLGMGEKLVAVPYNELRVSAGGDNVYLDSTKDALKAQSEFKYNDGELSGMKIRADREKSSTSSHKSSYADSVEYGKMRGAKSLYQVRASELIGETVEQSNGDNIGEVDDLVYSATDHKLMAIISVGGFLGMGDRLVAVPYNELRVSANGDNVYLDSTKDALKAKPEFKYN